MKYIKYILPIIFICNFINAQTADFIIVEKPSELTIYNKYQQYISDKIQSQLVSYTPFRIVNEDELLSDQISHASRVIYNDHILFLLKDEENGYLPGNDTYIHLFKDCKLTGDTIKILKNNSVSIFAKPEQQKYLKQHRYLDQGRICIRLFKFRNLYYIAVTGDSTIYGWSYLPKSGWEISHQNDFISVSIPDNLISRLKIRIESANQDYENYFTYFNKKFNMKRTIPYWNLEISNKEIIGSLNDPSLSEILKYSNRYLMQDIDNIFLGSNFVTVFFDSAFTIRAGIKR